MSRTQGMPAAVLRARDRGAVLLIAASTLLVLGLVLGRVAPLSRAPASTSPDAIVAPLSSDTQRFRQAIRQVDLIARKESALRAQVETGDVIARAKASAVSEAIAADSALLQGRSIVILSSGGKRVLVLDDHKYAVGDQLADGSVLIGIEALRLRLRDAKGRTSIYELSGSKTKPEGKGEKQ